MEEQIKMRVMYDDVDMGFWEIASALWAKMHLRWNECAGLVNLLQEFAKFN